MRDKITALMNLTAFFEQNKARGLYTKEELVSILILHYSKKVLDMKWYSNIENSFQAAVKSESNIQDWCTLELKKIGIFQASDAFQRTDLPNYHCMSFAFDVLYDRQDNYFSNIHLSFDQRSKQYLKQYGAVEISEVSIKTGDPIFYMNHMGWTHIALSIGSINGISYAVSKFGSWHNVCIHPINSVPDHYGIFVGFRNKAQLNIEANSKLKMIEKELNAHLNQLVNKENQIPDQGSKLHSGSMHLWPFKNTPRKPDQSEEMRSNSAFQP
ncbi:MAG: hypothetical protein ACHP65_09005 [Legionellales bacterium]